MAGAFQSSAFQADAFEVDANTVSGSFTADAIRRTIAAGSFTADSIKRVGASGSFTAAAVLKSTGSGSVSANAKLMPTFSANAYIAGVATGSFTANAAFIKTVNASFSASAILRRTWGYTELHFPGGYWPGGGLGGSANLLAGPFVSQINVPIIVRLDALSGGNLGIFTGNSPVLSDSYTQNTYQDPVAPTFASFTPTANWTYVYSFPYDGNKTGAGEVNWNWVKFTADAQKIVRNVRSFTADCQITQGYKRLDAVIKGTIEHAFVARSSIVSFSGTIAANAIKIIHTSGSFTVNAEIAKGFFRADALKLKTTSAIITAFAEINRYRFLGDAVIRTTRSGSFTADARRRIIPIGAVTVDAEIAKGYFRADAYIAFTTHSNSFTENAIRKQTINTAWTPIFRDDFNRVGDDLDTTWEPGQNGPGYTDGSYAVAPLQDYDYWSNLTVPIPTDFDVLIDYWIPSWADQGGWRTYYDVEIGEMRFFIYVDDLPSGTPYEIGITNIGNSGLATPSIVTKVPVMVDEDSWYTTRVLVQSGLVYHRTWKVGSAEPSTWTPLGTVFTGFSQDLFFEIDGSDGDVSRVDSLAIRTLQPLGFTADAYVASTLGTGSFTAYAMIQATVTTTVDILLCDDFNRVVVDGWGNDWVFYYGYDDDPASDVDGSNVVVPQMFYEAYQNTQLPTRNDYIVKYDIWIQSAAAQSNWETYYWGEWGPSYWTIYTWDEDPFEIGFDMTGTGSVHFAPVPESWYTVEVSVNKTANVKKMRVWKADEQPPDWQITSAVGSNNTVDFYLEADGVTGEEGRIDNFCATSQPRPLVFTANAWITGTLLFNAIKRQPRSGSFTADASLRIALTGFAIKQFRHAFTEPGVSLQNAAFASNSTFTATTSFVVSKPSGTAQDDFLIAFVMVNHDGGLNKVLTPPAGWSTYYTYTFPQDTPYQTAIYYKIAGASEPSTYTFTSSGATGWNVAIGALRGVSQIRQFTTSYFSTTDTPFTNITSPSTERETPGYLLVNLLSKTFNSGTITTPTGLTLGVNSRNFFLQQTVFRFNVQSLGGVLGPYSATLNQNSNTERLGWVLLIGGTGSGVLMDAVIKGNNFTANALITRRPFEALVAKAVIVRFPTGSFTLDGWVVGTRGSFTAAAVFVPSTRSSTITADADIKGSGEKRFSFTGNAWFKRTANVAISAGAVIEAVPVAPPPGFTADAIFKSYPLLDFGFFFANADIKKNLSGSFTANAVLSRGHFTLDAVIKYRFNVPFDAVIFKRPVYEIETAALIVLFQGGTFTANAWIRKQVSITANAWIATAGGGLGGAKLDAFIIIAPYVTPGSVGGVVITDGGTGYTTPPDVTFNGGGGTGATGTAVIVDGVVVGVIITNGGTDYTSPPGVVFTNGGGTGAAGNAYLTDPWTPGHVLPPFGTGVPGIEPQLPRVQITVGGEDISARVVWRETEFVQHAKTSPGTFTITTSGAESFVGGEEVLLEIDGFRQFGGYVLSIENQYWFSDSAAPKTILTGADYNILFDKLITYNKAWNLAHGNSGPYIPPKDWPKGVVDKDLITDICTNYLDIPSDLDFTTNVEVVTTAASSKLWSLETGMSWRAVMESISRISAAIWWIDPYKQLQYHDRYEVTAPHTIYDGDGIGISCRELTFTSDISTMVNDTIVWGTLANTVSGTVVNSHRTATGNWREEVYLEAAVQMQEYIDFYEAKGTLTAAEETALARDRESLATNQALAEFYHDNPGVDSVETWGRWQHGEFQSNIHTQNHINRRTKSILQRQSNALTSASLVIWVPGFQAGQVALLIASEYGVQRPLIIDEQRITFPITGPYEPGIARGLPRYSLQMGVDPEAPWTIYDALPFEGFDQSFGVGIPHFELGQPRFWIAPLPELEELWVANGRAFGLTNVFGPFSDGVYFFDSDDGPHTYVSRYPGGTQDGGRSYEPWDDYRPTVLRSDPLMVKNGVSTGSYPGGTAVYTLRYVANNNPSLVIQALRATPSASFGGEYGVFGTPGSHNTVRASQYIVSYARGHWDPVQSNGLPAISTGTNAYRYRPDPIPDRVVIRGEYNVNWRPQSIYSLFDAPRPPGPNFSEFALGVSFNVYNYWESDPTVGVNEFIPVRRYIKYWQHPSSDPGWDGIDTNPFGYEPGQYTWEPFEIAIDRADLGPPGDLGGYATWGVSFYPGDVASMVEYATTQGIGGIGGFLSTAGYECFIETRNVTYSSLNAWDHILDPNAPEPDVGPGWGCEGVIVRDTFFVLGAKSVHGSVSVYGPDNKLLLPGTDYIVVDPTYQAYQITNGITYPSVTVCYLTVEEFLRAVPNSTKDVTTDRPANRVRLNHIRGV